MHTPLTETDTIAAIATPAGQGGVGIVRVSGPCAFAIAQKIVTKLPPKRMAGLADFKDVNGEAIDQGIVLCFVGPHSFTGEDVVEFQGHGGPVILDMLLATLVQYGARLARPGEYSQRAFLNGKLDLTQAESIADLIASSSEQAAKSAIRSLQGAFSQEVSGLIDQVIALRMFVEAAIDFPEEEIDFLGDAKIAQDLETITRQLAATLASAKQGSILREGMTLVIAGQPNVGKSSLLNILAQQPLAIVTEQAGTTRDVLRTHIHIDGMPVHVLDTAGIRASDDVVEQEGVRRAWQEITNADHVLLVVDDTIGISDADRSILSQLPASLPFTIVHNKIDCTGTEPHLESNPSSPAIFVSAKHTLGIELLKDYLKSLMGFDDHCASNFIARRRHLDALQLSTQLLQSAKQQFLGMKNGELLAEDLRNIQQALGEITGTFSNEQLLDKIFSSFCIGK